MIPIRNNAGKIAFFIVVILLSYLSYQLIQAPVEGIDNKFLYLMKEEGYIILFAWSVLEGETGLVMAGLLSHTHNMSLPAAIFVAGLGGFVGDQIYFHIGRHHKEYVYAKFAKQRKKFALADTLLKKYGWPIIFFQRYMYGMRTVIPLAIGLTKYNAKKFAFINLLSAWCWAAVIIVPVWYFGEEILSFFKRIEEYWYDILIILLVLFARLVWIFYQKTK